MKKKAKLFHQFSAGFLSAFIPAFFLANPFGLFPKKSAHPNDVKNLSGDWSNIGNDIKKSYEQFKSEHC
jgi:hypothetical protein